jgi:DNA-binding protein H-NS
MSKLTALKKQIAALEAQAERIAKAEMSSAIAKVKGIMADFNLTIEHLTQSVSGKRAAKKAPTKAKAKTASVAKYLDPKTGKTWSGFGRAPGWIAGAKNRDAFLVNKSATASAVKEVPAAAKKPAAKAAKAVKVAKKAAKPAAKKASAGATPAVATKKKAAPRKAASKVVASAAPVEPAA